MTPLLSIGGKSRSVSASGLDVAGEMQGTPPGVRDEFSHSSCTVAQPGAARAK